MLSTIGANLSWDAMCVCGEWRTTSIDYLTSGCGCPTCSGKKQWTIERLFEEIVPAFQHKYYFGNVRKDDVYNNTSSFWISSYECGHSWQTSVSKLREDVACPYCGTYWTWERFLREKNKLATIDFSDVTPDYIKDSGSRIPCRCKKCNRKWMGKINTLFNGCRGIDGSPGCVRCSGTEPWSYEKFLFRRDERPDIDFSLVTPDQFNARTGSRITCKCKKCETIWKTTVTIIFSVGNGCPNCRSSRGERIINELLTGAKIPFEREFILQSLPRKRFDFVFRYNNRNFLVEYDGEQHFFYESFYHSSKEDFLEKQGVDVLKSHHAYLGGYFLIRIDYKQLNNIQFHLNEAIKTEEVGKSYYLSTPEMYCYLFTSVSASTPVIDK
jgi:very-short-patch-repair endonuclease